MRNKLFFVILACFIVFYSGYTQAVKKIKIVSADISTADKQKYPGATILMGNVKITHEGATLECKRALLYRNTNIFKAVGEVVLEQGDSIIQYSNFANYNGNTKIAKSWGNVEVHDKEMKLSTDTLYFDRARQLLYYPSNGVIKDQKNTLKSNKGTYYAELKKFSAKQNVIVTNPENELVSNHLDYFTNTNRAYLYGPSTVINLKDSTQLYAERGFYDSKADISHFKKHTRLFSKDKVIYADSMYYDKKRGFASATQNIKVIDSINNMVVKGNYAELFEHKDSLFITKRALAITQQNKDSMYVHGDTILITGKNKERKIKTFHNVKIYKSDLQGKCDSIFSSQATGYTKMYKKPVLWSGKSQITGDSIQFLSNKNTHKLDSVFIFKNAFMIQKDTLSIDNFNQIKGRDMYGKFKDGKIKNLLVKGNAESLYFNRNEKTHVLETVTKEIASDIEFVFNEGEIEQTKYFKKSEGKTYPPSKFPVSNKKFNGFIWRQEEQPKTKEQIFERKNTVEIKKDKPEDKEK